MNSDRESAQAHLGNGNLEAERLQSLVRELQDECNRLRQRLADAEAERDRYRQLFLSQARAAREFENLDIPTLEAVSAGLVDVVK